MIIRTKYKMRQLIALIFILFLSARSWSEGTFPQSSYIFPLQFKEMTFLDSNRIEYISEFDEGYVSDSFINSYTGSYLIKVDDPFTYLVVNTDDGKRYSYVIHWIDDVIILTDEKTKEILIGIGLENDPPVDLLPHLSRFYNVTATSYFSEIYGNVHYEYKAQNLVDYDLTTPWVEGKENSGIGEKIQFFTYDKTRAIAIANGYFDPTRPDLFYANNRLKKVIIRTFDKKNSAPKMEIEWSLKDTYNLQILVLREESKYFELEITDVYSGTKYDDTCLAGLFTHVGLGMYESPENPYIVLPMPIKDEFNK